MTELICLTNPGINIKQLVNQKQLQLKTDAGKNNQECKTKRKTLPIPNHEMSKQRSLSELQIHECSILKNIEQRPYSENIRSQNNVVNNARVSSDTRDVSVRVGQIVAAACDE